MVFQPISTRWPTKTKGTRKRGEERTFDLEDAVLDGARYDVDEGERSVGDGFGAGLDGPVAGDGDGEGGVADVGLEVLDHRRDQGAAGFHLKTLRESQEVRPAGRGLRDAGVAFVEGEGLRRHVREAPLARNGLLHRVGVDGVPGGLDQRERPGDHGVVVLLVLLRKLRSHHVRREPRHEGAPQRRHVVSDEVVVRLCFEEVVDVFAELHESRRRQLLAVARLPEHGFELLDLQLALPQQVGDEPAIGRRSLGDPLVPIAHAAELLEQRLPRRQQGDNSLASARSHTPRLQRRRHRHTQQQHTAT
mmetsp:Transcript_28837/g.92870  ORF Transcript_28837/g.92870 Transcript_28837/m.92870 type:complete len:305 (-) Transcript_28837:15-929(-)